MSRTPLAAALGAALSLTLAHAAVAAPASPPAREKAGGPLTLKVGDVASITPLLQYRLRFLAHSGKDLAPGGTFDAFSHRARLGMKVRALRWFSAMIQLQDVRLWGEETNTLGDYRADGFDVHQAWAAADCPYGLGIKAGRFRNDFGKINRWHQHALSQVDRPAVHRAFLGEEGLAGLGVSVSWLMPTLLGDYNELWVQVTNDDNDVAFSGRGFDTPVVTVHETNYWDLSPSTYFELGLSASTGVNDPDGRHRTWVAGADFNLNWSPPAEALYKGFELRGELLYERRKQEQGSTESWGAYLYGTRKLNQRWHLGLRLDWTQLPREPGEELWGVSPYVEFWQSEWARLRMQYSYGSRGIEDRRHENRFFFQVTWALGPHKHEKY